MPRRLTRPLDTTEFDVLIRDGFAHVPGFICINGLTPLARRIDTLAAVGRGSSEARTQQAFWGVNDGLGTVRFTNLEELLGEVDDETLLRELVEHGRLVLDTDDVEVRSIHALHKPAGGNTATPWHQDQAYAPEDLVYENLTFWIPTASVGVDNSCLEFVPGSHLKKVVRAHRPIAGPDTALVCDPREEEQTVATPVTFGDAVLHRSYVLHRARANTADLDRTALVVVVGTRPRLRL